MTSAEDEIHAMFADLETKERRLAALRGLAASLTPAPGDRFIAVEHDDVKGGVPKPGGRRYPATVTAVEKAYVQVRYDDPTANSGKPDCYYRDSMWRAWDGEKSWKLEPPREDDHDGR